MQHRRCTWWIGWLAGLLAASAIAGPTGQDPPDPGRPWMGVFLDDAVDGGVRLVAVVPGSPAELAGLQPGDILLQARELPLTGAEDLTRVLDGMRPGSSLELQLLRSGVAVQLVLGLAARPPRTARVALPVPAAPPSSCQAYGLMLIDVTPDLRRYYGAPGQAGVLVTRIDPRRPAANDGFRVGDLLVRLGREPVRRVSDVERLLRTPEAHDKALTVSVIRARSPAVLTLNVAPAAAVEAVSYEGPPTDPWQTASSRARFERVLQREVERVRARIEELKHKLEVLQSAQRD